MKNSGSDLTIDPIPALVRQLAIPASVGFFFHTMYNVVDTYFAGMISTQGVAALSLAFPVFFIIIATCNGLGVGATALIGAELGAKNYQKARMYAMQALVCGVIISFVLMITGWLVSPFLFSSLGASGAYLQICLDYMNIIFSGSVLFMLIAMFNAALNATGNTKPFRNFLIIGFLLNCGLDPWFIGGGWGLPAMGFKGIALATVLVQLVGAVYLGYNARETKLFSTNVAGEWLPKPDVLKDIAKQGVPSIVNYATIGLGIFVITYFISKFGKEAVAAYGVATRIEQIALMPTIGLNVATLSLVAQNNGARLYDRVREALKVPLVYGAWVMGVGAVVVFFGAETLMDIFSDDDEVIRVGAQCLHVSAFALYAYVILFVHVACLQGMKKPMFAVWIGLFRQIIAPTVLFTYLTAVLDTGLLGIWWGIFAIVWFSAFVAIWYARRLMRLCFHGDGSACLED